MHLTDSEIVKGGTHEFFSLTNLATTFPGQPSVLHSRVVVLPVSLPRNHFVWFATQQAFTLWVKSFLAKNTLPTAGELTVLGASAIVHSQGFHV